MLINTEKTKLKYAEWKYTQTMNAEVNEFSDNISIDGKYLNLEWLPLWFMLVFAHVLLKKIFLFVVSEHQLQIVARHACSDTGQCISTQRFCGKSCFS